MVSAACRSAKSVQLRYGLPVAVGVAAQAVLEGMPDPRDLRLVEVDGQVLLTVGSRVIAGWAAGDAPMRNLAAVTLRGLGFSGLRVAEVLGLSEEYVSTLRGRARREGSAGVVPRRGRHRRWARGSWVGPGDCASGDTPMWRSAGDWGCIPRRWAARWAHGRGRRRRCWRSPHSRPGHLHSTMTCRPPVRRDRQPHPPARTRLASPSGRATTTTSRTTTSSTTTSSTTTSSTTTMPGGSLARLRVRRVRRVRRGSSGPAWGAGTPGRCCCTRSGIGSTRPGCSGRRASGRCGRAALRRSGAVDRDQHGLRAGSVQCGGRQAPDPAPRSGRWPGSPRCPSCAPCGRGWPRWPTRCDPLELQARLAAAMLTADAPGLGVYFVDDHFVPYEGAKPVGKGWNTKRRHAQTRPRRHPGHRLPRPGGVLRLRGTHAGCR